jgi:S1-C subfamily serine protease
MPCLRKLPAAAALAALAVLPAVAADGPEPAAWRRTLEKVAPSIVSIQVDRTRAFDTDWNESSQATGFVVDAERGLVLTNRHVVTPGPVRAAALFTNQEEVELTPVYRDPVHDFGFFRYDPRALRYIQPVALPLVPSAAELGREVRVVGNDDGEQLSILSGTIARLRREAPDYGRGRYNDFNTFYLQAASGTSGGSSGSPVIDIEGRVLALNAGASQQAASSFFLPLDRIVRALRLLQAGEPVPRGHLGAVFVYRAFDELRRLGLSPATEAAVRQRFPGGTGMLVVNEVVPGSPADGQLRVGDVLVQVAGSDVTEFVPLEALLDDRVGQLIAVQVERAGERVPLAVNVQDLEAVSPAEYLQFGDAVVHDLSLQQARHFNRPVSGVFVANPGFVLSSAGIPRGSVVTAIDGRPVQRIDDLEAALDGLADRQRATLRYITADEPSASRLQVIQMDRRWFPAVRCRRDDASGLWPCRDLAAGPPAPPPQPGTARPGEFEDTRLRRLAPSLVLVNFDMPYTVSGVSEQHYFGTGVVVDAARGLVVVDRNTVPEAIGDVRLTFAGSLEVPGRVVYLHPTHNLALIGYDPALVGDTPVEAVTLEEQLPGPGTPLWVVGLRGGEKLAAQAVTARSVEPTAFPLSRTMRFRDANLDTLQLQPGPTDLDGVVVNRRGDVVALWSSFAWQGNGNLKQENRGLPATYVAELLRLQATGEPLRSLEAEFTQISLAAARRLGLPGERADELAAHDPGRRQALSVARVAAGTPAAALLQSGDVLLRIDGRPVTRFRELELAVQQPRVTVEVFRDGAVRALDVDTVALSGDGVRRVVFWGGAVIQAPYRDMAIQRGVPPDGVYVAFFAFGSPASRYGLYAGRRITAVDGQPVADLDSFIALVRGKRDRESVRLTSVTWNNQPEVLTLKVDETYWPGYQIRWQAGEWRREPL